MNLRVRFNDAAQRASKRVSVDTLDNALPERESYLADCNDISTPAPLITAPDENAFRRLFGIQEKQTSIFLTPERKGLMRRPEPKQGLIIDTLIPGQCLRFSIILGHTEMHAAIKKAPESEILHLDALQIVHDGKPENVPCGLIAGVEKDYMDSLIQCFAATAIRIQARATEPKTILEHEFSLKTDRFLQLLPVSLAMEASTKTVPARKTPRLER